MDDEIRGPGIVVAISANDLLGLLASAKSYLGIVQRMLDEVSVSKRDRRGIFGPGREGAVRRVNPAFEVNRFRSLSRSLELDTERINTALAFFNSSTRITLPGGEEESLTVGNALKEIEFINGKLSRTASTILNNVSYDYVEGDDVSGLEFVDELFNEYKALLARKTALKHAAYSVNSTKSVDVFLSTPELLDLINDL
jgi:hypothetical protein